MFYTLVTRKPALSASSSALWLRSALIAAFIDSARVVRTLNFAFNPF